MNKRLWSVYSFFYKGSIFLYPNRTQCHLKKIPTKLIKYGLCRDLPFYSISSLQSCYVVFFVDFSVRVQQVLSDFYLLHRFLGDCIVILMSVRTPITHLYLQSATDLPIIFLTKKRKITCLYKYHIRQLRKQLILVERINYSLVSCKFWFCNSICYIL